MRALTAGLRSGQITVARIKHLALLGHGPSRIIAGRVDDDTVNIMDAEPRTRWWCAMAKAPQWLLAETLRRMAELSGVARAEATTNLDTVVDRIANSEDHDPAWDRFQCWARRCLDGPFNRADEQRPVTYVACLKIAQDLLLRNTLDQIG